MVEEKRKSSGFKSFICAFFGAALACVLVLAGYSQFFAPDQSSTSQSNAESSNSQDQIINVSEDATLAQVVAAKALPSVCSIDVYAYQNSYYYGYNSGSKNNQGSLTQTSLGSGVVLSEDGYILTNYHVVEGGAAFKVTIEGEQYDAELVGSDESSDLAVLKAQGEGFTPIELGDSDNLTVGEWVMTIGSPFGLEQSVATGIVSATSRSQIYSSSTDDSDASLYPNMIQTDAAINPGNSGGALVDSEGKLIGINTLITSYSGNYSGVGFAIPVNYAINIAQQIIDGKTPTHAKLGVSLVSVNSTLAQRYGLACDYGAYVSAVEQGTGAYEAGLKIGDIIISFNGKKIESASDLMLYVRSCNPGDEVALTYNRDGEEVSVTVTLGDDAEVDKSFANLFN